MRRNKYLRIISEILATMAVTLILGGTAWAQAKFKTLHVFSGGADGNYPLANVVLDAAGNLYGTTVYGGAHGYGTVYKLTPNSNGTWAKSILHSFAGGADGAYPYASLILDAAGDLYGTASDGIPGGPGNVFELKPNGDGSWTNSVLYAFTGGSDGDLPVAPLIFDAQGNLYSVTDWGGAPTNWGEVFELTPNGDGTWTESVIYAFTGYPDGGHPQGGLIFDAAGNMYSTTYWGGSRKCVVAGCGVVYELLPNADGTWSDSILHTFRAGKDGADPGSALVFDSAGNLYGTTPYGSTDQSCEDNMCGTVFELTPDGSGSWTEKILHNFTGNRDGGTPYGPLVLDAAGNVYGTASTGGPVGYGLVFELTPETGGGWKETILHAFTDAPAFGADPGGGVIFDAAGNLYGTTTGDGFKTFGTVFEITP